MTTTPIESPATGRAERAGALLGRGYAWTVQALTGPIRRAPTPTWHRRAVRQCGTAVRRAAVGGAELAEVSVRCAPHRLRTGLRKLLRGLRGLFATSARTGLVRLGIAGGLAWWGLEWAQRAQMPLWPVPVGFGTLLLAATYAAGTDPAKRPVTRRARRRRERAAARLLWAVGQLLDSGTGLHLAELASQINERNRTCGREHTVTVAKLRALLEPLGVPIRDQLDVNGRNRPGIHPADWRAWRLHQQQGTAPAEPPAQPAPAGAPPTREEEQEETPPARAYGRPLSPSETAAVPTPLAAESTQVTGRDLEISGQDLGAEARMLLRHARTAIGQERGAHLRDILATAQAAGDCTGWSVTRLRRALEAAGVRVEDKLWIRGGNTRGVLATSLPPETDKEA